MNSKWSDWMTQNLDYEKTLTGICIPGTHHSESKTLEPVLSPCLVDDGGFVGGLLEKGSSSPALALLNLPAYYSLDVIKRLAITQYSTVYEQLKSGVRYLDFRVCYDQATKTCHTLHTVKGQATQIGLAEVRKYLDECELQSGCKEVVILEFAHNPSLDHAVLIELIESNLGHHLFRRKEGSPALDKVKLKEIVGSPAKPKAIIIYPFKTNDTTENHKERLPYPTGYGYWTQDSLNDIYSGANNVTEMEGHLTKELKKSKDLKKLTKLQYVLAAGAGEFLKHIFGGSLEDMESVLPERIQMYMKENDALFKNVNVIFIDFFNEYEYFLMDDILTLNNGGTVTALTKQYRLKFSRFDGGDIEWPAIQRNGPKIKSKYGYACNQGDNWMGIGQHNDTSAWVFEDYHYKGLHYLKRSTNNYIGMSSKQQLGTYGYFKTCGWRFQKIGFLQREGGDQEVCCLNTQVATPRVFACKPDDKSQTLLYVEKEYVLADKGK